MLIVVVNIRPARTFWNSTLCLLSPFTLDWSRNLWHNPMWNMAANNISYPIFPLLTRTEKGYITKMIPFFFCSVYIHWMLYQYVMCYIWVCVAYANHAQTVRKPYAKHMQTTRRQHAQLNTRSLSVRRYTLCIRISTVCVRYSHDMHTLGERYEHFERTFVPPNWIHTSRKLCVR